MSRHSGPTCVGGSGRTGRHTSRRTSGPVVGTTRPGSFYETSYRRGHGTLRPRQFYSTSLPLPLPRGTSSYFTSLLRGNLPPNHGYWTGPTSWTCGPLIKRLPPLSQTCRQRTGVQIYSLVRTSRVFVQSEEHDGRIKCCGSLVIKFCRTHLHVVKYTEGTNCERSPKGIVNLILSLRNGTGSSETWRTRVR